MGHSIILQDADLRCYIFLCIIFVFVCFGLGIVGAIDVINSARKRTGLKRTLVLLFCMAFIRCATASPCAPGSCPVDSSGARPSHADDLLRQALDRATLKGKTINLVGRRHTAHALNYAEFLLSVGMAPHELLPWMRSFYAQTASMIGQEYVINNQNNAANLTPITIEKAVFSANDFFQRIKF